MSREVTNPDGSKTFIPPGSVKSEKVDPDTGKYYPVDPAKFPEIKPIPNPTWEGK